MSNIIVQQENIQVCNVVIHNNIQTITSITNLKNIDVDIIDSKIEVLDNKVSSLTNATANIENDINDTNSIIFKEISVEDATNILQNL